MNAREAILLRDTLWADHMRSFRRSQKIRAVLEAAGLAAVIVAFLVLCFVSMTP